MPFCSTQSAALLPSNPLAIARKARPALAALLIASGLWGTALAQDLPAVQHDPVITPELYHDTSRPLKDLPPAPRHTGQFVRPLLPIPRTYRSGSVVDSALQALPATLLAPTTLQNFNGVGTGFSGPAGSFSVQSAPPDPNGDVGPNHYVQAVNGDFAVFDKFGTALYGPVPLNTLWSGFGGGCQSNNDGDPIVLYDPIADRWVISQFSVSTTPYLQCVAVSETPDPTGSWHRYAFDYGTTDFPDYPKMGVWPDAYYETFNIFANSSAFSGARACAYDRTKMLAGQAATQQCFNTSTSYGGILPADLDGATQPPAGSPNYLVALGASASNSIAYWKFHIDWTTPANSTFTGPTELATAAYAEACSGGTCIPQSGTTQQLDSLADRVMYRLAYRNLGDHEALVVNHSVTAGSSTGIRWYELRPDSSHNLSIFQQGTYAPDSNYRWMGSIAMDHAGNIGLGFSVSGSTIHPEIHFTGRLATDAAGTMTQGEGSIINGQGSQSGSNGLTRWGDYSSMTVDPSDDCTFWYTNEYIPATGEFNWSTRIGTFKLPGCGSAPVPDDFSISASPSSLSIDTGNAGISTISTAVTSGSVQTVALSVSGVPSGATGSFNPTSVTSGNSSTLTINTGTAAPGTYSLTVTGTGASATHTTPVSLTIKAIPTNDFSIAASPNSLSIAQNATATSVISTAVTAGTPQLIALSTSGLPSGATASFSDPNITAGISTTLILNAGTAAPGSYTVTVTGTGASATHSTSIALTVTSGSGSGITNGGFETGTLAGWTASGVPASVVTGGHSGAYAAMLGSTNPSNGDSSISQTFTASPGTTGLSFYYKIVCPDTVTYDWATATLTDNTAATTTTMLARTCSNSGAWQQATAAITAGHSYTLTLTSHDDNYATDPTYTLFDDVTLTNSAPPPSGIINGGFEQGSLAGWVATGATETVISSGCHGGTYCAQLGSNTPTNGDSSIAQTFTAPAGATVLSFWYSNSCPDSVTYDWATATLKDNTVGTTLLLLPKTCASTPVWTQQTATVTAGHSYTITLTNHDDNYTADPTFTLFDDVTINGASLIPTTTAISAPAVTYPSDATVTVNVTSSSGTPTGNVSLTIDAGPPASAPLSNGVATFTITKPSVGTHPLSATYGAQGTFGASSSSGSLVVNSLNNTATNLLVSPNPSTYGQTVTMTATVTPSGSGTPSGKVNFMDGATLLASITLDASATAVFTSSTLAVASHSLQADYQGDASFAASNSTTVPLSVGLAPTSTAILSAPSITTPANEVVQVRVTSTNPVQPTGNVALSVDAATPLLQPLDATGTATFTITSPSVGSHTLSASYAAQGNFAASGPATGSFVVNGADSTTVLTVSPASATFGQGFTLTAAVTSTVGTPTGSVTFADGTTVLGTVSLTSGAAQLSYLHPAAGSHSLTASYSGDATHVASASSSVPRSVALASTTTSLSGGVNPSTYGQSLTFTATITSQFGGAVSGNVVFRDGATTLATTALVGNTATFTTSALTAGSHSINAAYTGNANNTGSASASIAQSVNPAATSTALTHAPSPSYLGTAATFTATITSSTGAVPVGTVTFKRGPTVLGTIALDATGAAKFTTSALPAGNSTISAIYNNSADFLTSTNSLRHSVLPLPSSTGLVSSINPASSNNFITFTATVLNQGASIGSTFAGTPTGTVTFMDGSSILATSSLDSSGHASLTTKLKKGSHNMTASYSGDPSFTSSASPVLVQVVQ